MLDPLVTESQTSPRFGIVSSRGITAEDIAAMEAELEAIRRQEHRPRNTEGSSATTAPTGMPPLQPLKVISQNGDDPWLPPPSKRPASIFDQLNPDQHREHSSPKSTQPPTVKKRRFSPVNRRDLPPTEEGRQGITTKPELGLGENSELARAVKSLEQTMKHVSRLLLGDASLHQ